MGSKKKKDGKDISFTGTNFSYGDAKTRWGANRRRAADHNKKIKNAYKKAKADVESGKLKKDSKRYKEARKARIKNLGGRALATGTGRTKAIQGRYYAHRASGKTVLQAAALTYGNQAVKAIGLNAAAATVHTGAMFVQALLLLHR